ncbi:MAG TPA: polysaccharide deacetylase family protein [Ferruginibacter sp.]|nr:polysaccharide deacetylase family protein [Ferruginibacter sp.]
MFYLVKTPGIVKKLFPKRIWDIATNEKVLYLTFDDGPHPLHTLFVLEELKKYNAKATFFCIGENVKKYPDVYLRILEEGHSVGNHTFNHLNAWKTKEADYLANIKLAKEYIDSNLFRPPYGKINSFIVKQLLAPQYNLKTVMWSILSGDFDPNLSKEKCLENIILKAGKGDVIVFHDSEKASAKLNYTLPKLLEYYSQKGWVFNKLNSTNAV